MIEQTILKFPKKAPSKTENYLNCRVELNEYAGIIRYFGLLKHKNDNDYWAGVEWDDPSRGKHNGTVEGVEYFKCQENAGSLIKLNKLNVGISLIEAANFKYNFEETANDVQKFVHQQAEKSSFIGVGSRKINIELIGKDQAIKVFSDFSKIRSIELANSYVGQIDINLGSCFKSITELTLSNCLIGFWSDFIRIIVELPTLETLDLTENILQYDEKFNDISSYCMQSYSKMVKPRLSNLILNKCKIHIEDLDRISFIVNKLNLLYLYGNCINENTLSSYIKINPFKINFENMKELSLEKNQIANPILVLSMLNACNLTTLNLNGNLITCFPTAGAQGLVPIMQTLKVSLETLFLDGNQITSDSILQELQYFTNLKHIYIVLGNKYFVDLGLEASLKLLVGRFLSLKVLNNTIIVRSERKEYEVYYLKRAVDSFFKKYPVPTSDKFDQSVFNTFMEANHPTYFPLKKKHFDPLEDILHNMKFDEMEAAKFKGSYKINAKPDDSYSSYDDRPIRPLKFNKAVSNLLKVDLKHDTKVLSKTLAKATSFSTIRNLVAKLFGLKTFHFFVKHNGIDQMIDDESKTLENLEITNNSTIWIKS